MGNAGLIRDQQYQTDPDAGMTQMTTGKNADASQTVHKKTELRCTLLSYAVSNAMPSAATLHPNELSCTLMS